MAFEKFASEMFLELTELTRFKEFLDDKGFRLLLLQNTKAFGIINNELLNYDSFRIDVSATAGSIKMYAGYGIDSDGNILYNPALIDPIPVTNDSAWYWLKISHVVSSIETGTVAIDASGNLTGTGTEFLKMLRGQPNFPAKIKLSGANTGEYEVLNVVDDETAVLQNDVLFTPESGLTYKIIGTFSRSYVVPGGDKYPFQYDSVQYSLVAESVSETKPAHTAGEEFFIARVRNVATVIELQDKRTEVWQTRADHDWQDTTRVQNDLIGFEAARWDNPQSPRTINYVDIAWGFRSDNYTYNSELRKITISAGQGGKFKDTTDFTTGDFDEWRIYFDSGNYAKIITSTKVSTQINLILDILDPAEFYNLGQVILIVPNAEEIKFTCIPSATNEINTVEYSFPINTFLVKLPLAIYRSSAFNSGYNIYYQYRTGKQYSPLLTMTGGEYYREDQFNENGELTGATLSAYSNGAIGLIIHPKAYSAFNLGDILAYSEASLDNTSFVLTLEAGVSDQYQNLSGIDVTLTKTLIINLLKTTAAIAPIEGNRFIIDFNRVFVYAPTFTIQIRQDYVNAGTPGTLLYTLTSLEANTKMLCVMPTYDGTNWHILTLLKTYSSTVDVLNILNQAQAAWVAWTTVASGGGTTVISSQQCAYHLVGKTLTVRINVTLKSGTGNLFINLTLPSGLLPAEISGSGFLLEESVTSVITVEPQVCAVQVAGHVSFYPGGNIASATFTDTSAGSDYTRIRALLTFDIN